MANRLQNNQNIHNTGHYRSEYNLLEEKLDSDKLKDINNAVNSKENYVHRTILDHSLRDIMQEFTNSILKIIDDIVDIVNNKQEESSDDILDWLVSYMNIAYDVFHLILHKDNCLYVGILLIIITIFVHYFNISTKESS